MKNLPCKLLDEIVSHLPRDDKESLRNFSLVAGSWTRPSQRRLFETIGPLSAETLWSNLNDGSPNNIKVFSYVRSLSVKIDLSPQQPSDALVRPPHHGSPLFPHLRRMVMHYGSPSAFPQLGMTLASQNTLEYLSLIFCRISISKLVTLINNFPNLVRIKLGNLGHEVDNEPISPLARPLQKLSVSETETFDDLGIVDQLLELQPRCDEVSISVATYWAPLLTQRIIDGVQTTVRRLNLKINMKCEQSEDPAMGVLNGTLKFYCRSEQAFDTRELRRALRTQGSLSG